MDTTQKDKQLSRTSLRDEDMFLWDTLYKINLCCSGLWRLGAEADFAAKKSTISSSDVDQETSSNEEQGQSPNHSYYSLLLENCHFFMFSHFFISSHFFMSFHVVSYHSLMFSRFGFVPFSRVLRDSIGH